MKHLPLLILTISLSSFSAFANTAVNRSAAPADNQSITASEKRYHDYDNSDTVYTGQSATKREYQYDVKVKSCRTMNGTWLRHGEVGFAECVDNAQTLKK